MRKYPELKNIPAHIKIVLKIYGLTLIIFSVFRIILFITQVSALGPSANLLMILQSFIMGIRFDIVVASYILAIPTLLLSIQYFFRFSSTVFTTSIFWFVFILFTLSFMVCGADIPYFDQFFSRFSITAFTWIDSPTFVFKMIMEEPRLWLFVLPVILLIVVFYKFLKKILKTEEIIEKSPKLLLSIVGTLLFFGLIFLGIRGRIDEKSPIRVGTAYFSTDPLLNQLGLNPNFTLLRSYLDSKNSENKSIQFLPLERAILNTQNYFNFEPSETEYPLLRIENEGLDSLNPQNVVLIIMESMSAGKMTRHGNPNHLTPFLDSLSYQGYYFENAYSSGIHTFNGIFSSLFSHPSLFRQHPMKAVQMKQLYGISSSLKKLGYTTTYFTTHDGQFDNVEGFLRANDFDNIITKADYPTEEIKTTLGVTDAYMFEFAIPIIDKLTEENKPFFTAFMTASDHKPYYIPDYFKPKNSEAHLQITEFADYSLKHFLDLASQKEWFENTLFVFVADHGASMNAKYDVALNYNHVPLLFYAPKMIAEPKTFSQMAGQIDIGPSIMGLLNLPYENQTLGTNLFTHQRPYIYFNVDDKYAVIDQEWLLIVRENDIGLYKYVEENLKNYAEDEVSRVEAMKIYAESQMQVAQGVMDGSLPLKNINR